MGVSRKESEGKKLRGLCLDEVSATVRDGGERGMSSRGGGGGGGGGEVVRGRDEGEGLGRVVACLLIAGRVVFSVFSFLARLYK